MRWLFDERTIDIFINGDCDGLAVALSSLCQGCIIYAIKEEDIPIHYVCKFPVGRSSYVDIIGSWTEKELLQFCHDQGYTDLYFVEETPRVSMESIEFALHTQRRYYGYYRDLVYTPGARVIQPCMITQYRIPYFSSPHATVLTIIFLHSYFSESS